MSGKLVKEVLDNAPETLRLAERLVLVVIAENANEHTREARSLSTADLCHRTGLKPNSVTRALQRLTRHGVDVRVPIGKDRRGAPVYAVPGERRQYRLPEFAGVGPALISAADIDPEGRTTIHPKAGQSSTLKGGQSSTQGGQPSSQTGHTSSQPGRTSTPSRHPSPVTTTERARDDSAGGGGDEIEDRTAGEVVDGLPWPDGQVPTERERPRMVAVVAERLAAGWTLDQLDRYFTAGLRAPGTRNPAGLIRDRFKTAPRKPPTRARSRRPVAAAAAAEFLPPDPERNAARAKQLREAVEGRRSSG